MSGNGLNGYGQRPTQFANRMMQAQNGNYHQNNQSRRPNTHNNGNNRAHSRGNHGGKGPTRDTWKSPFPNREQNIMFFMYAYKCNPCQLRRNCPSKVTCPGWHHEGEKRRNPGDFPNYLYSEEPCPHVKPQGSSKWQPPSSCSNGDECGYSHTLLEQMYHPNIYKTSMCINFTNPRGNKCQWGYYCTHAHGAEDIRNASEDASSKDAKSMGNRSVGNTSDGGGGGGGTAQSKNEKRSMNNMNNGGGGGAFMANHGAQQHPPHQQPQHQQQQMQQHQQHQQHQHQQHQQQQMQQHAQMMGRQQQYANHYRNFQGHGTVASNMNAMNGGPVLHQVQMNNAMAFNSSSSRPGSPYQSHQGGSNSNSPNSSMNNAHFAQNQPQHARSQQQPVAQQSHAHAHPHHSHSNDQCSPLQRPQFPSTHTHPHTLPHPHPQQQHAHGHPHPPPSTQEQYRQYFNLERSTGRPKSISAPPSVDNHILNQFPHASPLNTPLPEMAEDSMLPPDPRMTHTQPGYFGPNSPSMHHYNYRHLQHHQPHAQPPKTRSRTYDANSGDPFGLPRLDANDFMGRTASDGVLSSGFVINDKAAPETHRRQHSYSEPLKPDFMLNDAMWSFAPSGSAENIKFSRPRPKALTDHRSKSDVQDHIDGQVASQTQRPLSSIPDCLLSPSTMEALITPKQEKQEMASEGKGTPSSVGNVKQGRISQATWHAFGFSKEEVMSPVDATHRGPGGHTVPRAHKSKSMSYADALADQRPSLSNRESLKVPMSPTAANLEVDGNGNGKEKGNETERLRQQLATAMKEIEALKMKAVGHRDGDGDGKEEEVLSQSTPLEASSKKSVDLYANKTRLDLEFAAEDMKMTEEELLSPMAMNKTSTEDAMPRMTSLQQQQLARYEHFITCPSCKVFDQNYPRNQVLVPCGHLLCTKCTAGDLKTCPLCQSEVGSLQPLVIG